MALDDVDVAGSPGWWFKLLASDLQDRRFGRSGNKTWSRTTSKPSRVRPGLDLLADHVNGDPPLGQVAEGWREAFRETTRIGRLNVAALLVEQKANRMPLRGFRTSAASDELGDEVARQVMRANRMAVKARDVHTGFLTFADSYVMVTPAGEGSRMATYPGPDGKKVPIPTVTAEDPRECITMEDPVTGETIAGLKLYHDRIADADVGHLFIRLDDGRVLHRKAVKPGNSLSNGKTGFRMASTWDWVPLRDPEFDADSGAVSSTGLDEYVPKDRMPIHHFTNRDGVGEFERHLDTLDRINDQILNKLVIAKIQAFRQRAVKGLPDTRKVRQDNKVVEQQIDYSDAFIAGPGELWKVPADVDFWESEAVDFRPLLQSIKDDLAQLCAVTATPLNTVMPDAANGSAEGASVMREAHVYAVEACRDQADRPWANVMADVFAFMGDDERADAAQIEAIWGPVERYSLSEKADADSKATSMPVDAKLQHIWQFDPAEIPHLKLMQGRDLLTLGAGAPAPTAPGGTPAVPPPSEPPPAQPTLTVPDLGVPGGSQPAAAS